MSEHAGSDAEAFNRRDESGEDRELQDVVAIQNELESDPDFIDLRDGVENDVSTDEIEADPKHADLTGRPILDFSSELMRLPLNTELIDAYGCGITEIPDSIGRFQNLRYLDLSQNDIREIPAVIGQLKELRYLDLGRNKISRVSNRIGDSSRLTRLNLPSNLLDSVATAAIGKISSLEELDLSGNVIEDLHEEFFALPAIRSLTVSNNSIRKVSNLVGSLKTLRTLDLRQNELLSLPPGVQWLRNLDQLDLSQNKIRTIPSQLSRLDALRILDLSNNRIAYVPPELARLSRLATLDLSRNEIKTLPIEFGNLSPDIYLELSNNPLDEPLPGILSRGVPSLLTYLRSLVDGRAQYEAKVLLVGEGGVGKSSLIAALRGEVFIDDRPTTHGIEINCLNLEHPSIETTLTLNSWDFGGQEVYRITHQFFFSRRALYILVWKPREGQEENGVLGWCRRLRLRVGNHARVLIVATHSAERRAEFDYQELRSDFPNLLMGYHILDSESGEGIPQLRAAIAEQASLLPQMGEVLSESWTRARDRILECDGPHISRAQFSRICYEEGLDENGVDTLSALLHDLGHIVHYADDDGLKDLIVLQPEWLTKAIGYVLEDEETRSAGGVVDHDRLAKIWGSSPETDRYSAEYYPYFLRLMEKFDVSYRLPNGTSSLVAQLVPYTRPPDIIIDSSEPPHHLRKLYAVCSMEDEAPGLIAWLTVRNHRFSTGKHWRRGVSLANSTHSSEAVMELSKDGRMLHLTVVGPFPEYFFHILKDGIEELIQLRWRGLKYDFLFPCPGGGLPESRCTGLFPFRTLQKFRSLSRDEIVCYQCAGTFSVSKLLTGVGKLSAPANELLQRMDRIEDTLQELAGSTSRVADMSRVILRMVATEVDDCPRLFTLRLVPKTGVGGIMTTRDRYHLTLWCEEPGSEHPCIGAPYVVEPPKAWFEASAPYLRVVAGILKFVVPIATAGFATTLSSVELSDVKADLDFMKTVADKLPEVSLASSSFSGLSAKEGAGLRAFRAFLFETDKSRSFCGLRRVTSGSGDFLWVCPEHHHLYDPGLPQIG